MKRTIRTLARIGLVTTSVWLVFAAPAAAQEIDVEQLAYAIDTVWIAVCSALVLLMHLGFGMLEAGLTRSKNAANIVGKNMVTVAIGGVAYWAVGAAFAYGGDGGFIGTNGFWNPASVLGDGTQGVFQLVFAATAATIVSGAVAERVNFWAYVIFATVITGFIYPVVTHWQWFGDGAWLFDRGFHDFAGSTLVHMTGGVAALVGIAILGPRIGKYGKDGKPRAIPGHSIPLAVFGVLVLFFGWFGFNGGSTLAAVGNGELIGLILMNTTVAGSAGALAAMVTVKFVSGKPDVAMIGNGALAGLVAITAGADKATNLWAFAVGLIAGVIVVVAVLVIDRAGFDDPVGAVAVHGVNGAFGTLMVAAYASGVSNGSATEATISIGTQLLGVVAVGAFVAATTAIVWLVLRTAVHLRVSEQEEMDGLDAHEHGVYGYPDLVLGTRGGGEG